MQFVSLPMTSIVRPALCPISLPQIMSYALAADFKKYSLAYLLNDLPSSEKDEKKCENAETSISTSSFEEIILGKGEEKVVQGSEKNRKTQDSIQIPQIIEEIFEQRVSRKRECFERARCQITQAFESSQQSRQEQEQEGSEKGEQISYKDKKFSKKEQIKQKVLKKQKKIKKSKKSPQLLQVIQPQQKLLISTTVSLIDTIDHPRITIDRYQIQQKKESLLSRAIVYDECQNRRFSYQIRERREIRRLY